MAIENGIITAGPRLAADVAAMLGTTDYRLSYLCGNGHGKTRWWAKYKPVPFAMDFPRSGDKGQTLLKNGNGYYYWQGTYGNCGLVPLTFQTYASVMSYANGGVNGWVYQAPTGGASAPYRLGDFIGYAHVGRQGIGTVSLQGSSMAVGDTGVTVYFNAYPSSAYDLGFADIASIKDCKFGVFLTRNNGASGTYVINPAKITDTNTSYVTLSGQSEGRPEPETVTGSEQTGTSNALKEGTYKIYPFLFDSSGGVYYSIPYAEVMTLEVKSKESVSPFVKGVYYPLQHQLVIKGGRVSGNISYSATFYNIETKVPDKNGKAPATQMALGEGIVASGTATATNGQFQVTINNIMPDPILEQDGRWQLWVTATVGGTTYTELSTVFAL